jgi:hypothetical protein
MSNDYKDKIFCTIREGKLFVYLISAYNNSPEDDKLNFEFCNNFLVTDKSHIRKRINNRFIAKIIKFQHENAKIFRLFNVVEDIEATNYLSAVEKFIRKFQFEGCSYWVFTRGNLELIASWEPGND